MKTPMRLLLVSAAVLLNTIASHCLGATEVIIPIPPGSVIASGSTLSLSATTPIDKAPIYFYSISGTVVGQGDFAALTGSNGLSLAAALLATTGSGLAPYLQGAVLDPSSKFPFTAINKLSKGTFAITSGSLPLTVTGAIRGKAGITGKGIAYGELTNISYTVKIKGRGSIKIPKTDYLTFAGTSGQIIVQTNPITSGSFQPDLSFLLHGQLYGVGITGTASNDGAESVAGALSRGQSITIPVILQNIGSQPDTFKLTATPVTDGWSQTFTYRGKNVTAQITGAGFTIPPDKNNTPQPLPSGAVETLTWKIKNKDAVSGSTQSTLNAASNTAPACLRRCSGFLI
jgi:hypothetical protein